MIKINLHRLAVVLLFAGWMGCDSTRSTSTTNLQDGKWTELKSVDQSLPVARHEAAFVGIKDQFFLLGGRGDRPVSIYNTKTNMWSSGQQGPIELHHFQPVVYQNEIYIMGAMTGGYPGETPVEHIYIYNPAKDNWRKGAEIPEDRRRGGAGAALHDDKIYLACGIRDGHRGDHKKWLDVYDLKTQEWSVLPDAPRPRDHFQIAIVDEKIYAIGGRTTRSAQNPFANTMTEVDVFDMESQTWSTLEQGLPTPRAGHFMVTIGKHILVLGGESFYQEPGHSEVERLNTTTLTWSELPLLPQGRHGTGAILRDGKIYTSSGSGNRGGGPELTDLWVYEP